MRTATVFFIALACAAVGLLFLARGTEATSQEKEKPPGQAKDKDKDQPPLVKWEYKVVNSTRNNENPEPVLNQLGGEGWELVSYSSPPNGIVFQAVLKRTKR